MKKILARNLKQGDIFYASIEYNSTKYEKLAIYDGMKRWLHQKNVLLDFRHDEYVLLLDEDQVNLIRLQS